MRLYTSRQILGKAALGVGGIALILSGGAVHAGNFFVGTTLGEVDIGDYELESVSSDLDDTDFGYSLFAGWRFNRYFAVGASYVDLGELEASGNSPTEPNFRDEIEADGYELWVTGSWPLTERFSLVGKVGAFSWDQEVTYSDDFGPWSGDSDDTDITYGIGAHYDITDRFGVHAAYQWYPDIGDLDETGHKNDRDFYGVGFTWLFGEVGKPAPAPMAAAPPPPPPPPAPPPPAPKDGDGDGVVDASDLCPDTPRGDRVDSQGCSCDVTKQLQFAFDSAELTDADKASLDETAANLARLKFIVGTVEGHTDSVGTEAYNQGLSERRAQAVADYLQGKGISVDRMTVTGHGESLPVADNTTADGRMQNRRVVLKRTDCR